MSFGFNLRQTSGYVTDPAGTSSITTSPETAYPSTRTISSVNYTIGYVTDAGAGYYDNGGILGFSRDRDSGVDARLAGSFIAPTGARTRIRIDLPEAGIYDINLAAGDALYSSSQTVRIYDTSTLLTTIATNQAVDAANFMDAQGDIYSAAAWPASNAALRLTFATTECRIEYGDVAEASNSSLNHVNFTYVVPAQTVVSINDGDPVYPGQTGVDSVTTGFTGLPATITTNAAGVTCSSIGGTTNAPTFTISDRVDGSLYPKSGTSVLFTFALDDEVAVDSQTITAKPSETIVEIEAPLFVGNTLANAILLQTGRTIATGDQFNHTSYSGLEIFQDTDLTATGGGSFDLWLWVSSGADAGKVYYYAVTITESGAPVISGGGLTTVGLTSSGFTSSWLTSTGL